MTIGEWMEKLNVKILQNTVDGETHYLVRTTAGGFKILDSGTYTEMLNHVMGAIRITEKIEQEASNHVNDA